MQFLGDVARSLESDSRLGVVSAATTPRSRSVLVPLGVTELVPEHDARIVVQTQGGLADVRDLGTA